tara:strand:- start:2138 stop:3883 length:1746 start_codon:yes stop_codon:yes gene_type:complete
MKDLIAATSTKNHAMSDTILDWLELYGEHKGFVSDTELETYNPKTDFTKYVIQKGIEFERLIKEFIENEIPIEVVNFDGNISEDSFSETISKMCDGVPIIYQAPLKNMQNKTFGVPDFLFRSDILNKLFPYTIPEDEVKNNAPNISDRQYHYRVVDVKFITLNLKSDNQLSTSNWDYMMQIFIYNQALGLTQGYTPPEGYLLGRRWKTSQERGNKFTDKLARIPNIAESKSKGKIKSNVENAIEWLHKVKNEGDQWQVTPEPSNDFLRPNISNQQDYPWHSAKSSINAQLKDLTSLWQVSTSNRSIANKSGIFKWDEENYSVSDLGFKPSERTNTIQKIIDINKQSEKKSVLPLKLTNCDQAWRDTNTLDFYVDFETVSDIDDDFSRLPSSGGQAMIFMIGCGYIENEEWIWKCFIANSLTQPDEKVIIESWCEYMKNVSQKLSLPDSRIFHWHSAETSSLNTAYNSAKNRFGEQSWENYNWYDLRKMVVAKEPLTIKGSFGFGLKAIAKSLYKLGLIDTSWNEGPTDGLGAMAGAWQANKEANAKNISLKDTLLIKEIQKYNEVDCKVMWEIVKYLRQSH